MPGAGIFSSIPAAVRVGQQAALGLLEWRGSRRDGHDFLSCGRWWFESAAGWLRLDLYDWCRLWWDRDGVDAHETSNDIGRLYVDGYVSACHLLCSAPAAIKIAPSGWLISITTHHLHLQSAW